MNDGPISIELKGLNAMKLPVGRQNMIAAGFGLLVLLGAVLAPSEISAQVGNEIITGTQEGKGKPVQIEADSMEVLQEAKQAVFTGNVDAKKGNLQMTSDSLVVDYSEVNEKREITHLNARGSVIVVSKGQRVQAQWAKMDVRANTVVMGDNVTVFDGRSVIKGRRLELDLTTGESRFVGGRVQGTFFQ